MKEDNEKRKQHNE